jgi:hypothetical protein
MDEYVQPSASKVDVLCPPNTCLIRAIITLETSPGKVINAGYLEGDDCASDIDFTLEL